MRLIDADALMRKAWKNVGKDKILHRIPPHFVDDAPTVDAEPVRHGKLLWHEDWGHPSLCEAPEIFNAYWICSVCGIDLLQYIQSHFPGIPSYVECVFEEVPTLERCPYCGAKFDEEEETP